jgi:hypothetical protein
MRKAIIDNVRPASFGENGKVFYTPGAKDPFTYKPISYKSRVISSNTQAFNALFFPERLAKSVKFDHIQIMDEGLRDGSRYVPGGKTARTILVQPKGTGFLGIFWADAYYSSRAFFNVLNTSGNTLLDSVIVIRACKENVMSLASDFSNFDGSQKDANVFNAMHRALETLIAEFDMDVLMYDETHTVGEFLRLYMKKSFTFPIFFKRKPLFLDYGGIDKEVEGDEDDIVGWNKRMAEAYPNSKGIFNFLSTGHKLTLLINSIVTKSATSVIIRRIEDAIPSLSLLMNDNIGDDSITLFNSTKKITAETAIRCKTMATEVATDLDMLMNFSKTLVAEYRAEFIQNFFIQSINIPKPITSAIAIENITPMDQLEKAKACVDKFFGAIYRNTFSFPLTKMLLFLCTLSYFRIFEKQKEKNLFYQIPLSYLFLPSPFGLGVFPTFSTFTPSHFFTLNSLSPTVFTYVLEQCYKFRNVNARGSSNSDILNSDMFKNFNDKLVLPAFGDRVDGAQAMKDKLIRESRFEKGFDVSATGRIIAETITGNLPKDVYIAGFMKPFVEAVYTPFEDIPMPDRNFTGVRMDWLNMMPYTFSSVIRNIDRVSSYAYHDQRLNDFVAFVGVSLSKPYFPSSRSNIGNAILNKIDRDFAGNFTDERIIALIKTSLKMKRSLGYISDNLIAAGYSSAKAPHAAKALYDKFTLNYNLDQLDISVFNEFSQKLDLSNHSLNRFFNYKDFSYIRVRQLAYSIVVTELLTRLDVQMYIHFDTSNQMKLSQLISNNKLRLE